MTEEEITKANEEMTEFLKDWANDADNFVPDEETTKSMAVADEKVDEPNEPLQQKRKKTGPKPTVEKKKRKKQPTLSI